MPDDDSMTNDPAIVTDWGRVTPWARRQAVLNLRRDPAKLAEAIERFGEARMRRDFPECFEDGGDADA